MNQFCLGANYRIPLWIREKDIEIAAYEFFKKFYKCFPRNETCITHLKTFWFATKPITILSHAHLIISLGNCVKSAAKNDNRKSLGSSVMARQLQHRNKEVRGAIKHAVIRDVCFFRPSAVRCTGQAVSDNVDHSDGTTPARGGIALSSSLTVQMRSRSTASVCGRVQCDVMNDYSTAHALVFVAENTIP